MIFLFQQLDLLPPTHKLVEKMPSPRTIKTHLPGAMLPTQLFDKQPKIIYIARNPKDIAVSYYHMHQKDITLQTYKDWSTFIHHFIIGDGEIEWTFLHISSTPSRLKWEYMRKGPSLKCSTT